MSIPPDMMGGMMAPPGGPQSAPIPAAAPIGAPMSTPEPAEGHKTAAITNVQMAINMLEQALPSLGSHTEDGQIVLNALKSLSRHFGETKSQDLIPAELQMLMQQGQQPGPTPGAGPAGPAVPPTGGI